MTPTETPTLTETPTPTENMISTIDPASQVLLTLNASEKYAVENCGNMLVAIVTANGKEPERIDITTPDQAAELRRFKDAQAVNVDFEVAGKTVRMKVKRVGVRFVALPETPA